MTGFYATSRWKCTFGIFSIFLFFQGCLLCSDGYLGTGMYGADPIPRVYLEIPWLILGIFLLLWLFHWLF
ncbi:hypothetical protein QBC41DRAFT_316569 [Cercophora samala]|uniref:Uncharacterized protein n=1 Tax=Cercophora samala TaxID=330535 RepID=A0AA39ZH90_9PEZI|nr:hypothetical protein QBC41DRAFT_316569 [Cercophora samala]